MGNPPKPLCIVRLGGCGCDAAVVIVPERGTDVPLPRDAVGRDMVGRDIVGRDIVGRDMVGRDIDPVWHDELSDEGITPLASNVLRPRGIPYAASSSPGT